MSDYDFQGINFSWREGCMLSLLDTAASHEAMSYKYELYIHCKMSAPPPNRKTRFTLSVLQRLCQPTKRSPGNFKMQTLKKNTLDRNGTGLTECLSQPQNSPAWLWQPALSCAELALSPQTQQSLCTSSWNSQAANSSTPKRGVSVEPQWFTAHQPPETPTSIFNGRVAPRCPQMEPAHPPTALALCHPGVPRGSLPTHRTALTLCHRPSLKEPFTVMEAMPLPKL